jgi:alanyl-tRNA synthetase
VVGDHVEQAGSYVSPDNLRFDFTHYEALTEDQIIEIESIVNNKIIEFIEVKARELPLEEAKKTGATAQFGEKYSDIVRVISVGEFSSEFCGGTHVGNTGQIGAFKIVSENGVAAGVRRIEAITGSSINDRLKDAEITINKAAEILKSPVQGFLTRLGTMAEELKSSKKELEQYKKDQLGSSLDMLINNAREIKGVSLITGKYDDSTVDELRAICDSLKQRIKSSVIVLASIKDGKVTFIVSITDDLLDKGYHAGNMVKKIASVAGGGGGGKADMAQAGAKDPSKVDEALAIAETLL